MSAEALLKERGPTDGLFLIRSTGHDGTQYALSLCFGGVIFHNLINYSEELGFTNSSGTSFPTLAALVADYHQPCPDVQTCLTDYVKAPRVSVH